MLSGSQVYLQRAPKLFPAIARNLWATAFEVLCEVAICYHCAHFAMKVLILIRLEGVLAYHVLREHILQLVVQSPALNVEMGPTLQPGHLRAQLARP